MNPDLENLRNKFNNDWRTQEAELVDQIRHLYHEDELTDVLFVFNRNETITV